MSDTSSEDRPVANSTTLERDALSESSGSDLGGSLPVKVVVFCCECVSFLLLFVRFF